MTASIAATQPATLLTFLYPMLLRHVSRGAAGNCPAKASRARIRSSVSPTTRQRGFASASRLQVSRGSNGLAASSRAATGSTKPSTALQNPRQEIRQGTHDRLRKNQRVAEFHSTSLLRDNSTRSQRYGVSVEPQQQHLPPPQPPHLASPGKVAIGSLSSGPKAEDTKEAPKEAEKKNTTTPSSAETASDLEEGFVPEPQPESPILASAPAFTSTIDSRPLETMLHVDAPLSEAAQAHKPPHLQPPPYVHHFDTYSLVRDLEHGGFTDEQCVTLMKAVRGLLAENLTIAKEGLVSKSDVENETYLFRAACSELRTEIQNNRKKETDKMRTERTALQHEVDILNQNFNGELLSLKDDLRGMFDDRRMAVRQEQRAMESKIQELNWQITVLLNSDSKSEVEGLRWVLTRRAALAVATMAFLILGSLRYSSYMHHVQERTEKQQNQSSSISPTSSSSSSSNSPSSATSFAALPHFASPSSPPTSSSSPSSSSSLSSSFSPSSGSSLGGTSAVDRSGGNAFDSASVSAVGGKDTDEVLAGLDDGDGRSSYVSLG
ncbi:hypothetical protein L228DRAFT_249171 [Xylona heveae TC161]|uniref:DUF1640-domain-containing protein n=1 Tax=Xylona heveae (strain CBS 132557 / TC161) TaxID=1328760 RepID=A0A165FTK0_XYLHT|nr:hypothetical protein L228DRAFT_249171 [Xylona heveae TC161]KZF21360.1 hypothetical protein L228DRAFT_249171 [Xylona heveae TC161]